MSKEIAVEGQFDKGHIDVIKNMYFKGASDVEFESFMIICKKTGLDPIARQIYPVRRGDSITIQTSIDGFRVIAERTGKYMPGREPTYTYDKDGKLLSATSYVKKITKDGIWHEIAASAYYSEYSQLTKDGRPTQFWAKMPHLMLAKCAEALCLRRAFPNDMSGIYTDVEMQQADVTEVKKHKVVDVEAKTQLIDPTLSDLQQAFSNMGEPCDKAVLAEFVSYMAVKHGVSDENILRSAMNAEDNCKKLYGHYLKHLELKTS